MPPAHPHLTTITHLPIKRQLSGDSSDSIVTVLIAVIVPMMSILIIIAACRASAQNRKDRERLKQIAVATQQTAQIATANATSQGPAVKVSELGRGEVVVTRVEKGETERVEVAVTTVEKGETEGRGSSVSMDLRPTYELPGGK